MHSTVYNRTNHPFGTTWPIGKERKRHGHRIYFLRSNTKSTEQIKARIYHWQKSKRIARILKKTRINTGKTGVVVV